MFKLAWHCGDYKNTKQSTSKWNCNYQIMPSVESGYLIFSVDFYFRTICVDICICKKAHKATSGTCWEPRGSLKPFSQDIGWLALQAKCSSGGTNQNSWDWHLWISLSAKSAVGRQKRWEGKCVHPKVSLWIASCDRFSWATVTGQNWAGNFYSQGLTSSLAPTGVKD